ncbi:MAG: ROK family protein [Bacillales bacterium]|nr:ROK family protein [Bacillales bacterium]MDY5919773.1 ROK family protein [Candidatus Enteromonas sp.]
MSELVLAIDIGGTSMKGALVDRQGHLSSRFVVPVVPGEEQESALDRLIASAKESLQSLSEGDRVIGIGCGVPGGINTFTGVCDYASNLGWKNLPVARILSDKLSLPCKIDNDANAAMLGEIQFGQEKAYRNAILLTLGTGIGGGIFVNGQLYVGNEGKGAEIGHMVIVAGGIPCPCGRKGCFETYASATALTREAKKAVEAHPESLMAEEVRKGVKIDAALPFECAKKGDEVAQQVVDQYIEYLGVGCLNLIDIFRPEVIVLSGGVSKQGENLRQPLERYLEKFGYGFGVDKAPKVDVKISRLGADIGIYGAAALGFSIGE